MISQPANEFRPDESADPALFPDYGFGQNIAISGDAALIGSRNSGTFFNQYASFFPRCIVLLIIAFCVTTVSGKLDTTTSPLTWAPGLGNAQSFDLVRKNQTLIIADDGQGLGDFYGYTVAIDGSTALLGAYRAESSSRIDRGVPKAFVYVHKGSNEWVIQAVLDLVDEPIGNSEIFYGTPQVALSGDTAVVSNPYFGAYTGKVWVYVRSDTSWNLQQRLEASDGDANHAFGYSIVISGDVIVVGSPQPGEQFEKGEACAYRRSGNTWSEEFKFTPDSNAPEWLTFGGTVA